MSLINDAIKQAHKANKDRTPPSAPATAGMQSADAQSRPAAGDSMSGMFIIAGIVVFVLLGGALLFLSLRGTPLGTETDGVPPTGNATGTLPAPVQPAAATVADSLPSATSLPAQDAAASALTNPVPEPVAPTGVPAVAPSQAVSALSTGPRPFPELKLQGIYYRLTDPSVMINGKALEIGDLIEDAKVIKIDRKEVTLELDGQQKVLRLQ